MGAAVNIALPVISNEFSLTAVQLSWIPMSFLLASAIFLVPFGKIADMAGRKKIFTIGTIFKKNDKFETNIEENDRLAVAIASENTDYTEVRQVLDYLFRSLDLKYEIIEAEHNSFVEGRVGRVIVNGKKIAYIGEISPNVINNFELEVPVSAFELNLTELYNSIKNYTR